MKQPLHLVTIVAAVLAVCALSRPVMAADAAGGKTPNAAPKWKKVLPQTQPGITSTSYTIATYDKHNVTLVVYVPDKPGTYPAILDIHGGGWSQRQVEADKPMMERLATHGFVTALVAYRLSGEAKYPAALYDCKSAVRIPSGECDEVQDRSRSHRRHGRLCRGASLGAAGHDERSTGFRG